MTAEELLERFRAEVRVAELAHAFPPSTDARTHFTDVTIDVLTDHQWFLNEWQASLVSGANASKEIQNAAATKLFGLPASPDVGFTWEEASDRLIYIAHNMFQADTGSKPNFGDAIAVFNTEYVRNSVMIAPTDTGMWHFAKCDSQEGVTDGDLKDGEWPPHDLNCSAWDGIVGTLDYHDHLILSNWAVKANNSIPGKSLLDKARDFFSRSAFAGDYDKLPNMTSNEYWEADIVANPSLPASVKFLIGHFPKLFGTQDGRMLQNLANHYAWPLTWALGDGGNSGRSAPPQPGNERLLDPATAEEFTNATLSSDALVAFEAAWSLAEQARAAGEITPSDVSSWWSMLKDTQTRVAPLTAYACEDTSCFGTTVTSRDCICPDSPTMSV